MNKKIQDAIRFGGGNSLPLFLQSEATECGMACMAMISAFYGRNETIRGFRARFRVSLSGMSLRQLVYIADAVNLAYRTVRLETDEIRKLKLPCILHWEMSHFVVLKKIHRKRLEIHDPAYGVRKITFEEFDSAFTGVAMELWPNEKFEKKEQTESVQISDLIGRVRGVVKPAAYVVGIAFALEVISITSPLFTQWTVDHVLGNNDESLLLALVIGLLSASIIQSTLAIFQKWVMIYLSTNVAVQWRSNLFSHLIRLPADYFERRHLGDVVSRFKSSDAIQQTLTSGVLGSAVNGVMCFVTLAIMLLYSPILASFAIISMCVYAILRALWYRPLRDASYEEIIKGANTESIFLETIKGIRPIQIFGMQLSRHSIWSTALVEQINASIKRQRLQLGYDYANAMIFGLEGAAILWIGAGMVMQAELTVGMLMAFLSYKSNFNGRVTSLINAYFAFKMLSIHTERLADIVYTPASEDTAHSPASPLLASYDIELKNVSFAYAHLEPMIIDEVSMHIQEGDSVAIVGRTGAGKTTLIQLILGRLKPLRGHILLNKTEQDPEIRAQFMHKVSTVMQDDVLFAGTIFDNITLWDEDVDEEHLNKCLSIVQLAEEVKNMPMRLHTLIGDMGSALSGGQRQRLLLCRALYRKPAVLILDEATSNLDVLTEKKINEAIKEMRITRIVVAHRPATISSVDRVIYLDGGKNSKEYLPENYLKEMLNSSNE